MVRYDYENWNLHDAKLISIEYIWNNFEVLIYLKAFICDYKEYIDCRIRCTEVTDLQIPHKSPWGDSNYINNMQVKKINEDKLIELEIISGDYIKIQGKSIELIYEDIKNRGNTLKELYGFKMIQGEFKSSLIEKCIQIYNNRSIYDYTIEELRLMIGQELGLDYLIPVAIEILEQDILAEGDFYAGDLLKSVLSIDKDYWKMNTEHKNRLTEAINNQVTDIINMVNEFNGDE